MHVNTDVQNLSRYFTTWSGRCSFLQKEPQTFANRPLRCTPNGKLRSHPLAFDVTRYQRNDDAVADMPTLRAAKSCAMSRRPYPQQTKVFWFFFSKKNILPCLLHPR
jgi:hypothetical protein